MLSQENLDVLTELALLVHKIQIENKVSFLPIEMAEGMVFPEPQKPKRGRPKKKSVAELRRKRRKTL